MNRYNGFIQSAPASSSTSMHNNNSAAPCGWQAGRAPAPRISNFSLASYVVSKATKKRYMADKEMNLPSSSSNGSGFVNPRVRMSSEQPRRNSTVDLRREDATTRFAGRSATVAGRGVSSCDQRRYIINNINKNNKNKNSNFDAKNGNNTGFRKCKENSCHYDEPTNGIYYDYAGTRGWMKCRAGKREEYLACVREQKAENQRQAKERRQLATANSSPSFTSHQQTGVVGLQQPKPLQHSSNPVALVAPLQQQQQPQTDMNVNAIQQLALNQVNSANFKQRQPLPAVTQHMASGSNVGFPAFNTTTPMPPPHHFNEAFMKYDAVTDGYYYENASADVWRRRQPAGGNTGVPFVFKMISQQRNNHANAFPAQNTTVQPTPITENQRHWQQPYIAKQFTQQQNQIRPNIGQQLPTYAKPQDVLQEPSVVTQTFLRKFMELNRRKAMGSNEARNANEMSLSRSAPQPAICAHGLPITAAVLCCGSGNIAMPINPDDLSTQQKVYAHAPQALALNGFNGGHRRGASLDLSAYNSASTTTVNSSMSDSPPPLSQLPLFQRGRMEEQFEKQQQLYNELQQQKQGEDENSVLALLARDFYTPPPGFGSDQRSLYYNQNSSNNLHRRQQSSETSAEEPYEFWSDARSSSDNENINVNGSGGWLNFSHNNYACGTNEYNGAVNARAVLRPVQRPETLNFPQKWSDQDYYSQWEPSKNTTGYNADKFIQDVVMSRNNYGATNISHEDYLKQILSPAATPTANNNVGNSAARGLWPPSVPIANAEADGSELESDTATSSVGTVSAVSPIQQQDRQHRQAQLDIWQTEAEKSEENTKYFSNFGTSALDDHLRDIWKCPAF